MSTTAISTTVRDMTSGARVMDSNVGFVLKVLAGSALIAIAIKTGGTALSIAPTTFNALILVALPTVIMAGILGWRAMQRR